MKTEQLLENMDQCYGCGACYNVCPESAINMLPDEGGFLYPSINQMKCSDCGLCKTVCPVTKETGASDVEPECYAVMGADQLRMKSSSGGAFSLLASSFISSGGYVCGAAFSNDYQEVEHIIIAEEEDLCKLRKSKYVQSDTKDIYKRIKDLLQGGTPVLFSGCPCQVAGLKSYLGTEYDNLTTIDLICHGVPSPKAWKHFLTETSGGAKVQEVDFRDKTFGWNASLRIACSNQIDYLQKGNSSKWLNGFLGNIMNRKSCGDCPFPYHKRIGDITLGDFWGIGKYAKDFDDNIGTSLVLLNSRKGKQLFRTVSSYDQLRMKKFSYSDIRPSNVPLYKHFMPHPGRRAFFSHLDAGDTYDTALEKAIKVKYDVGIVGRWFTCNYGAAISGYALYRLMQKMDFTPLMIDAPDILDKGDLDIRNDLMPGRRFINRHCNVSKRYSSRQKLRELNDCCNSFLVGSDQLWRGSNHMFSKGKGFYFLDFVDDSKRKVSYATSFGKEDFIATEQDIILAQHYLKRFDSISVRESSGLDICREKFGLDAVQSIDPVFLCSAQEYERIIDESEIKKSHLERDRFITAYILHPTKEKQELLQYVSDKLNCRLAIITDMDKDYIVKRQGCTPWFLPHENQISMEDWLYYMAYAEYVITDSYHGLCFSIIFNRDFICLEPRDGLDRFLSLAAIFGLENRIGIDLKRIKEDASLFEKMDYSKVNSIWKQEYDRCFDWLNASLNPDSGLERRSTTFDALGIQMDYAMEELRSEMKTMLQKLRADLRNQQKEAIMIRKLVIKLLLEKKLYNKRIAIKGAGKHTAELLKLIGSSTSIACIAAREKVSDIGSVNVVTDAELQNYQFDIVIISSYKYRKEMKEDLEKLSLNAEILDLYDYLAGEGLLLEREFYY